jgi:hypothetical protein
MIHTRRWWVVALAPAVLASACADEATVPTLPSIALEGSVASAPETGAPTSTPMPTGATTAPTDLPTTLPGRPSPTVVTAPATSGTATSGPATPTPVSEDDLARFVAATETAIAGTVWAGAVQASAEIWVAVAQAACARFSDGETFETVADDLVATFSDPDPTDVERLVGAVLGAATRTICPEHADLI